MDAGTGFPGEDSLKRHRLFFLGLPRQGRGKRRLTSGGGKGKQVFSGSSDVDRGLGEVHHFGASSQSLLEDQPASRLSECEVHHEVGQPSNGQPYSPLFMASSSFVRVRGMHAVRPNIGSNKRDGGKNNVNHKMLMHAKPRQQDG